MKTRRDVYQAIADPTRRAIISMVAGSPHNVTTIAEQFKVTRQAISLHVKILADCGLIQVRKQGRDRFCLARLGQLHEVATWVEQYRQHWELRLDKMENYITTIKKERYGKQKK